MTRRVRKAVFPVGGLGTRFLPATKAMPKEMLPIVDKPLIQYAVEEAAASGIEEFIFVTGRNKSAIEDHFDFSYELENELRVRGKVESLDLIQPWRPEPGQIAYLRQMEALGLGHAVWCARHLVGDEPFAVLLADDLVAGRRPVLGDMIDIHRDLGGNVVAVMRVDPAETSRYGVVDAGEERERIIEVRGLVEKPEPADAPSDLAVIGRYVLEPEIMDHLGKRRTGSGGEIQLTDALHAMIGSAPFHAFRFDAVRYDCGTKAGFVEANIAYALNRSDIGATVRAAAKRLVEGI